ncbi:MAG: helix-turn-helix domain-containing protein [Planctomycetota bacterium]|nr:helix-turn-helix domain-containing protein [Planctomycetota bacterium]
MAAGLLADLRPTRVTPAGPPGLLASGYFREQMPYQAYRPNGTRDWLLTFTIQGRGRYLQPGLRTEACPGDLVLLEPGAYHDYGCVPGEPWEFVWAHFIARPHWIEWLAFPAEGKGLRRLPVADEVTRERLRQAFLRCYADSMSGAGGMNEDLALNALEEAILLGAREQALSARERPLSPGIRRAVETMAERLAERQQVETLARLAGLSPSRFAHRFKEETGDSVIAYLLKLRLRQAARLLEYSGRSVKEVAADVGFESPFYFSRQFKKHFRVSPRAYQQARRSS